MKIDDKYLKEVCQLGTEKCCAYLVCGAKGFECAKNDPSIKPIIEQRLAQGTMRATGDNCEGYKILN